MSVFSRDRLKDVRIEPEGLDGILGGRAGASGLVIFAHGSGSGRMSPRNNRVAASLREAGFATLLLDLLKPDEERNRANVFDIGLLATRLAAAARWARLRPEAAGLPIGYFGASTGAAAALVAAAADPDIAAIVSRGGRPGLAGEAAAEVSAPTMLIVGGADTQVIELNRSAFERMSCEKELVIVPGAGHLFEEPGTLEQVMEHACRWFGRFLPLTVFGMAEDGVFKDRRDAGRRLAAALMPYKQAKPVVVALPRGGVPVAFEVAKVLNATLDVALVRKIGAPGRPELGLGAVIDGSRPELVLNDEVVEILEPDPAYIEAEKGRQLAEIERRRTLYRAGRPAVDLGGRTVIVVDDGIATGGTVKAVLSALRRSDPERLILAVPVAPREAIDSLSAVADEVVCLSSPDPFRAVGIHYRDFTQTTDEEVIRLLDQAREFPDSSPRVGTPR